MSLVNSVSVYTMVGVVERASYMLTREKIMRRLQRDLFAQGETENLVYTYIKDLTVPTYNVIKEASCLVVLQPDQNS